MNHNVLFNFISPVTGSIKINEGYTIIGDEKGISTPSAVLKYLQNDFLKLKKDVDDLNYLEFGAINLGNKYNIQTPIKLGAATFPLPNSGVLSLFSDIPIPNPTFNPLSAGDWVMSGPWLPQIFAGSTDSDLSNPLTKVSSSLAMTQIRTAKNFKLFDHANFIVGSRSVSFLWDNPAYLLANLDPKLAAVLALYDLGTTYNFTKAQSLGDLGTGLLKNTVSDNSGTLSKAIPGTDYVELTNDPIGTLVVYNGEKFISPTEGVIIRKNNPNEFGEPIGGKLNILDSPSAHFTKLALTSITTGLLVRIGESGQLIGATKGIDYIDPNTLEEFKKEVKKTFEYIALLIQTIIGAKIAADTITSIFSITTAAAGNLNKVVKTVGGISDAVDMVDAVEADSKLLKIVKNAVGVKDTVDMTGTALKAADVFTNKAGLVELEAQIAALAGVQAISTLTTILGFVFSTIGGYEYGQYIRGQSLNVKNRWDETDLNDESHNAVGDFEVRYPSGYNSDSRGKGTLWFDSNGRDPDSNNYFTKQKAKSEGGLRIFSWDSGGDRIGSDSPLAPLHIGLFGYQNKRENIPFLPNRTPTYKGFIFRCEFDNNKTIANTGVIFDDDNPNYRFPTKFGLYDVTRKISSGTVSWEGAVERHGFSNRTPIFEYDYKTFNFEKPVKIKNLTITDNLTIPTKLSSEISNEPAGIGSIFYCPDV